MRRFFTRHWVWLHIAVAVTVPTFLGLGWWQVVRAGTGNARSYGYAIEWPSLAAIVIFLYIRAIRMELHSAPAPGRVDQSNVTVVETAGDRSNAELIAAHEAADPELAAYNEYLTDLHHRDLQQRR
jgi:DNA-binding transcriptional regulator of glucitol operon